MGHLGGQAGPQHPLTPEAGGCTLQGGPTLPGRHEIMPGVPTTAGDIDVGDLGVVLMHEHVFIRT